MKGPTRGYIAMCFSIWLVSLIIGSTAWLNTLAGLEVPTAMNDQVREQYVNLGEAVKLVTDQGYSVAEAARNLGVNANLLGRWKKESEQPANDSASTGNLVPMQAELKRLKRENKQLKMEREILKKAL